MGSGISVWAGPAPFRACGGFLKILFLHTSFLPLCSPDEITGCQFCTRSSVFWLTLLFFSPAVTRTKKMTGFQERAPAFMAVFTVERQRQTVHVSLKGPFSLQSLQY